MEGKKRREISSPAVNSYTDRFDPPQLGHHLPFCASPSFFYLFYFFYFLLSFIIILDVGPISCVRVGFSAQAVARVQSMAGPVMQQKLVGAEGVTAVSPTPTFG